MITRDKQISRQKVTEYLLSHEKWHCECRIETDIYWRYTGRRKVEYANANKIVFSMINDEDEPFVTTLTFQKGDRQFLTTRGAILIAKAGIELLFTHDGSS